MSILDKIISFIKGLFGIKPKAEPVTLWTITNGVLTVTARSDQGGAISSIVYGGTEFIDSADHGRLLQTAIQWDGKVEGVNPTQAGAGGSGPASKVLSVDKSTDRLTVSNQMMYWNAVNGSYLSNDKLTYSIDLNHLGRPNLMKYNVAWTPGESHELGSMEVLTAYLPTQFTQIKSLNPHTGEITDIDFSGATPSMPFGLTNNGGMDAILGMVPGGSRAIALYSTNILAMNGGYYPNELVGKLDVIKKVNSAMAGSPITHEVYIAVGTLQEVIAAFR